MKPAFPKATLALFFCMIVVSACSKQGDTVAASALSLTLGAEVPGATLSGALAGKTLYFLGGGANHTDCWQDSEYWDGSTLWYAMTSLSFTHLSATTQTVTADPGCTLPAGQTGTNVFNIYAATLQNGSWNLTNLAFNTGATSFAAPKLSGNQMAYVSYEKGGSAYGNIYFTTRTGANSWTTPSAFSLNSTNCDEDNPDIYSSATKIIFESSRTNAAGTTCNGSSSQQKLWQSSFSGGSWQSPTLVGGAPSLALDATQPWVDESTGKLYYTADSTRCGGGAIQNCIVEADPAGTTWSSTESILITPTAFSPGVADGKLVYIGQYTQGNGFGIASCAIATETDPTGSTPGLIQGRWTIYISACVVPL